MEKGIDCEGNIKNSLILKIRDFIIGFRFKKYNHKYQGGIERKKKEIEASLLFNNAIQGFYASRQIMAFGFVMQKARELRLIQLTPAMKKNEKIEKACAVAGNIIDTQTGIMQIFQGWSGHKPQSINPDISCIKKAKNILKKRLKLFNKQDKKFKNFVKSVEENLSRSTGIPPSMVLPSKPWPRK